MHDKERSVRIAVTGGLPMLKHSVRNRDFRSHIHLSLLLVVVIATPIAGWNLSFTAAGRRRTPYRLDDTLTSTDSRVGDPFRATIADRGLLILEAAYVEIRTAWLPSDSVRRAPRGLLLR
jgi:hypothetical protein